MIGVASRWVRVLCGMSLARDVVAHNLWGLENLSLVPGR